MSRKVMQIGYEPERDRLTWDGWDIHCGQGLEVLLPDRLGGGTWRAVSFEYNADGWYMPGQPGVSPVGLGLVKAKTKLSRLSQWGAGCFIVTIILHFYIAIKIDLL